MYVVCTCVGALSRLTILLTSSYVIWKNCEETALRKLLADVKETLPAPVQAGTNSKHITLRDPSQEELTVHQSPLG